MNNTICLINNIYNVKKHINDALEIINKQTKDIEKQPESIGIGKYELIFLADPSISNVSQIYDEKPSESFCSMYAGDENLLIEGEFGTILTNAGQNISLYKKYHKQIIDGNADWRDRPKFIYESDINLNQNIIIHKFKSNYPLDNNKNKYMLYITVL